MLVPPEQRSIPPRWEAPKRPSIDAKRRENADVTLIILISALALFAPVAGGTLIAVALARLSH